MKPMFFPKVEADADTVEAQLFTQKFAEGSEGRTKPRIDEDEDDLLDLADLLGDD
jgi:hypothetical protein